MTATAPTPITAVSHIPQLVADLRATFKSRKTLPHAWRAQQLRAVGRMLRERKDDILAALSADLGKSAFEGFLAEIALCEKEVAYMLDNLDKWMQPEKVSTPLAVQPGKSRIYRDPLGVVLIIAPWNYPAQLALLPMIGAIAAGNCVVVKPSEVAANTSQVLAKLIPEYLDTECVKVVEGAVPETTALLEQRWDHIFYTGNGAVGRIVMAAAAKHLTPVTLELGGKCPVIVDRTADLDVAARRVVWGKFFNAGQTCLAPDYILVHDAVADRFTDKLAKTIRAFYGDDARRSKDYARIINERHHDRLTKLLEGCKVVAGGDHDRTDRYIAPTLLRDVSFDAPIMQEEIFGPLLPIHTIGSMAQAIELVNERDKPLALYVFSEDKSVQDDVLSLTSSGGACVNDVVMHFTVPDLPFGGVGESGMGAYHGRASFETFTHKKSVLNKSRHMDLPLRYPPYDDNKAKWLQRLM